jgi:ABC-type branched-subunit amino acid transport system permease subunit
VTIANSTKVILICVLAVVAAGLLGPSWMLNHLLIAVSRALVVVPLMILLRTGLVTFGQALYFSVGAYVVVFMNRTLSITDVFAILFSAAIASAMLGLLIGFLVRGHRRIFFAMLNLALSMIFYGALIKSEWLGSSDGFSVRLPTFAGQALPNANGARVALFLVLMATTFVTLLGIDRYIRSTLGRLSEAVRDNDLRVVYLGYPPHLVVHVNFTIAALLAGLGGALTALSVGHVDPDSMANWTISGEFVFVVVMSGTGHVLAPLFGSLMFEFVRSVAYDVAPQLWNLIVGLVLLAIILFLPDGLSSIGERLRRARS